MTVYDPYGAVLGASSSAPSSSSPPSSRPSTSSSNGPVAQQGEKSPEPTLPSQQQHHRCPPPPYSPTFRQHPSLRTTLFEPTSFDDGVVVRRLEGQSLGSSTPPPPSSPTSTHSSAVGPNAPPVSPTRRSVTFSTAGRPGRTKNNDAEDEEDDEKTTAVHHSRPASRSHSVERGASYTKKATNTTTAPAAAGTRPM